MKPDSAVIYFTVCSGTGYGIIISLLIIFFGGEGNIDFNIKLLISIISFFLIVSGLLASTIHLGHPERAWRALSQWKSSWLSREGVAAIITFMPLTLFFIFWMFTSNETVAFYLLVISSIFSALTVFCTAKIYSSLKAIPAWNNPLVPMIYLLNSLVLGSIINFTILFYFEIRIILMSKIIIILCCLALFTKLLYWYLITKKSKSNITTATGLGNNNKTNFFEGPHTGKNYLTSEMINKINISRSFILRLAFCIFTYVTPAYYILQQPQLVINHNVVSISFIIMSILAFIGMIIERYLFFIEAKHTVSLFYGNKTI